MHKSKFIFLSIFVFSTVQAGADPDKPLRYARLHGTIEKTIVSDVNSVKSAMAPKREKVCDIDLKVPVDRQIESKDMPKSSPCSTTLQGKPANVYVMGRMYLVTGKKDKASRKEGDLLFFVESSVPEISGSFAAGAYTSNLSLQNLSLWYGTRTFESTVSSQKTGEQFTVDVTFDDQGK
jgi:hypothetical protein